MATNANSYESPSTPKSAHSVKSSLAGREESAASTSVFRWRWLMDVVLMNWHLNPLIGCWNSPFTLDLPSEYTIEKRGNCNITTEDCPLHYITIEKVAIPNITIM
jgi:hypothetical protein